MQMADEPDDSETERDHENQKNNSAFPSLFAQGNAPSSDAAVVAPAFVLERHDPKNYQRQSNRESDLQPLREGFSAAHSNSGTRLRQFEIRRLIDVSGFEPAALLAEFRPRIINGTERPAQLLRQLRRVPSLGLDRFEQLQMLRETFVRRANRLELLLAVVSFAFEDDEGARELVRHFRAAALEFFLAPAQLFQFAFLFFDLLLLPL